MTAKPFFDVIVVGGGLAGSVLAGVLARGGRDVLLVEKEARFRDRVRGEATWPYGVADALAMGLGEVLETAGCVSLEATQAYAERRPSGTSVWADDSVDGLAEIGFLHPRLQETLFTWADAQGATALRPAKAVRFSRNGGPALTVARDGCEMEYRARLIVGADGKRSMARRWNGGGSAADPERTRMGGVLVSGVRTDDRNADNVSWADGEAVNWFAVSADRTRLYAVMTADRLRQTGADRSFAALLAFVAARMPEGALDDARQEGPIGFFPNSDSWASRLAGNGVTLVGDAAGAPDPTVGHGTALLFHDVRTLSDVLLAERDWERAIEVYAERRAAYYAVIHAADLWRNLLQLEQGPAADRLREGHQRARDEDASLGGFAWLEARGPDGLVADDAARRTYFGEASR